MAMILIQQPLTLSSLAAEREPPLKCIADTAVPVVDNEHFEWQQAVKSMRCADPVVQQATVTTAPSIVPIALAKKRKAGHCCLSTSALLENKPDRKALDILLV